MRRLLLCRPSLIIGRPEGNVCRPGRWYDSPSVRRPVFELRLYQALCLANQDEHGIPDGARTVVHRVLQTWKSSPVLRSTCPNCVVTNCVCGIWLILTQSPCVVASLNWPVNAR